MDSGSVHWGLLVILKIKMLLTVLFMWGYTAETVVSCIGFTHNNLLCNPYKKLSGFHLLGGAGGGSFPPKPSNFPPKKFWQLIQYLIIKTLALCFFMHWWLIPKNGLKNFACFTHNWSLHTISPPQTKNPRWNPGCIPRCPTTLQVFSCMLDPNIKSSAAGF